MSSIIENIQESFQYVVYDLVLHFFNLIVHTFFRDVKTRGTFNIPPHGPVIFVIAPHHNQYLDALLVMSQVNSHTGRHISFLIAGKSYRMKVVGHGAYLVGAIPVERAQDILKKGTGKIFLDPNDTSGHSLVGEDTKFLSECEPLGLIGLYNSLGNCQIDKIIDDTHLKLKKPFVSSRKEIQDKIDNALKEGTPFKIAPHIDNHHVFNHVFRHLGQKKVLGIFPEGGSHDRPDLLPLKPGVAIMALGTISEQLKSPDGKVVPVNIIPVGLNYFHAHRFRSRVVIEFGKPIVVDEKMGLEYNEDRYKAVNKLLERVTAKLKEVTTTSQDYDTLMVLQAIRRLHTSGNREYIPLPMVVEMNRKLSRSYEKYKDEQDVIELRNSVTDYNALLLRYGLHDHHIETLRQSNFLRTLIIFLRRFFTFCLYMGLSLPGMLLFSPVFITAIRISNEKQKQALAGSVVKIRARDVISTWKCLVALVLAPALYIFYSILGTIYIVRNNLLPNIAWHWIFLGCYGLALLTTYASLRVGEIGVDYYKSLRPLLLSLISPKKDRIQIAELKLQREKLAAKVNDFCLKYNPAIFADYNRLYGPDGFEDHYRYQSDSEVEQRRMLVRQNSLISLDLEHLDSTPIFSSEDLERMESEEDSKSDSTNSVDETIRTVGDDLNMNIQTPDLENDNTVRLRKTLFVNET
ncbi:Glycerol-3-phosphate O-acyltransferase 1 [Spathaspora sp. JA1]|nr:Glycerol-3-phosphate O-acyltransferase 1 [Spathaspora sp. JA1]